MKNCGELRGRRYNKAGRDANWKYVRLGLQKELCESECDCLKNKICLQHDEQKLHLPAEADMLC